MGRHRKETLKGNMQAMKMNSREAENNVAASTEENTNQKGHVPNSPSTG